MGEKSYGRAPGHRNRSLKCVCSDRLVMCGAVSDGPC